MNRYKIWALCLFTSFATAALNTLIWWGGNLNLFSLKVLLLLPIGAVALCMLALSGFYFPAKRFNYVSTKTDLFFLFGVALMFGASIFLGQYLCLLLAGLPSSVTFQTFFISATTETQHVIYLNGKASAPATAGDAGWIFLLIQFAGLLAAARSIYSFADNHGSAIWHD